MNGFFKKLLNGVKMERKPQGKIVESSKGKQSLFTVNSTNIIGSSYFCFVEKSNVNF